jgi:hypothetical protein
MAHRTFQDERGRAWQVWDVHPTADVVVRPELREGWLAFEHEGEKRRLCPIPEDWEAASEPALITLLARATPQGKERRKDD